MTELSPLDVLGKSFSRRVGGYDPREVHEFLGELANVLEGLLRERGELRRQVTRLEQELAAYREREAALQEALVAAQKTAEATREEARREAERLLERARLDGERIVQEAQALAQRVMDETAERIRNLEAVTARLRQQRREARADLMRLVEVLEGVARDDQRAEQQEETTSKLSLLDRRRATGEGEG